MKNTEKKYIFDNPRNIKIILIILYVLCAVIFFADMFVHKHAYFFFEEKTGFYAVYGFISYVGLVLFAKYVIRPLIMRKENYYE